MLYQVIKTAKCQRDCVYGSRIGSKLFDSDIDINNAHTSMTWMNVKYEKLCDKDGCKCEVKEAQ